jgi:asparagine synthase (glutamine-hydrolysing)
LLPGHALCVENGVVHTFRYWDVHYDIDWSHTESWFGDEMRARMGDWVKVHLRSDVPLGVNISGSPVASVIGILASREAASGRMGFHGKFTEFSRLRREPICGDRLPAKRATINTFNSLVV